MRAWAVADGPGGLADGARLQGLVEGRPPVGGHLVADGRGVQRGDGRVEDLALEHRTERGDAGGDADLAEGAVRPRGHPLRWAGTTPTAPEASTGLIMPMPRPPTMKPGSNAVQLEEA